MTTLRVRDPLDIGNEQEVSTDRPLPVHDPNAPSFQPVRRTVRFTRPNDANAYTAADIVGQSTTAGNNSELRFGLAAVQGGGWTITNATIVGSSSAGELTGVRFRLHLYRTNGYTKLADNAAAATPLYAEVLAGIYLGKIDFGPMVSDGSAPYGENDVVRKAGVCDPSDDAVYGVLETLDAFTPVARTEFVIELTAVPY